MTAFTIIGLFVFWCWCFRAGWWIGFLSDVMSFSLDMHRIDIDVDAIVAMAEAKT